MMLPTSEWMSVEGELNLRNLRALTAHQVQVLRIPRFVGSAACADLAGGLRSTGYSDYRNAPSVGRIGMSYFETERKPEIVEHYFATALANVSLLRMACAPHPFPVDTLRCLFDELWPAGCGVQVLYGRKMFVGLSRRMAPGVPLLAHHDMFGRHAPGTPEAASLVSQFAINVYVEVPEAGGELALWRDEITDAEFLERRGPHYGIPLGELGPPDFTVKPQDGDLILFNARKLHAVLPGVGRDRLTLSAFLGYRGPDERLTVWS